MSCAKPRDDRPCWCDVHLGWLVCPACVPLPTEKIEPKKHAADAAKEPR